MASVHTPGPWHVNGINSKQGRITGDETSTGWDKLQVHGTNATVATVYRPRDARLIAAAPRMLALLRLVMDDDDTRSGVLGDEYRAILRDVEGKSNG